MPGSGPSWCFALRLRYARFPGRARTRRTHPRRGPYGAHPGHARWPTTLVLSAHRLPCRGPRRSGMYKLAHHHKDCPRAKRPNSFAPPPLPGQPPPSRTAPASALPLPSTAGPALAPPLTPNPRCDFDSNLRWNASALRALSPRAERAGRGRDVARIFADAGPELRPGYRPRLVQFLQSLANTLGSTEEPASAPTLSPEALPRDTAALQSFAHASHMFIASLRQQTEAECVSSARNLALQ